MSTTEQQAPGSDGAQDVTLVEQTPVFAEVLVEQKPEHVDGTPLSGDLAHECPKCGAPAVADGALLTGRCRCPQGHRWQDTAPVPQKASAH